MKIALRNLATRRLFKMPQKVSVLRPSIISSSASARFFSDLKGFTSGQTSNSQSILQAKKEAKDLLKKEEETALSGQLTEEQLMRMIREIKTMEEFKQLAVSNPKPVVFFAYASWCNTSKQVLPDVIAKYSQYHQLWDLVLFDIDKDPQITKALQLNKLPSVLLIDGGKVLDGRICSNRFQRPRGSTGNGCLFPVCSQDWRKQIGYSQNAAQSLSDCDHV